MPEGQRQAKLNKAIILDFGHCVALSPLTKYGSVSMFPIINRPLIEWTLNSLISNGIVHIMLAGPSSTKIKESVEKVKRDNGPQVEIQYHEEDFPRGTAGILQDLDWFIDESVLVINCNRFIRDINFDDFLQSHNDNNSVLTIGMDENNNSLPKGLAGAETGDGTGPYPLSSLEDESHALKDLGIYLLEPIVLQYITTEGYFDLDEQLIPALHDASLPTYLSVVKGYCKVIKSPDDYLDVHREHLCHDYAKNTEMVEIAEKVWVGKNATIGPDVSFEGPVIIGDNCTIENNVKIKGLSIIGDGCHISENVSIDGSVLWKNVRMEDGSRANHCIIAHEATLRKDNALKNCIVVDALHVGDINLITLETPNVYKAYIEPSDWLKYRFFRMAKRFLDINISFMLIISFLPIMLLACIIIKLDSKGSILFRQKRCGRYGKNFEMLKFRTMQQDAEKIQQSLMHKKEVDGPMFKIAEDPRITRVGKFLRKSSIDELPQLFNVLKGEMSIVGPRPLIIEEMKFDTNWRDIRLKVEPGISGLWQVEGRRDSKFHNWIKYDNYYVKNQSLWMDLRIMFKTFSVVLARAGAY